MDLETTIRDEPDGVEVLMSGELLFLDSESFMRTLPMRVEGKGPRVTFNMRELKFIDSSGLGAILYVSEALRMQGQRLEIKKVNENNLKLLKVIQNVGTFTIVE